MNLRKSRSEHILSCYKNDIEKALRKEWRDVHTKYGVHQQRYNVGTDVDEEKKDKHPFGGDTTNSAALKDAVFYGIKYNGRYYDSRGDRIPLNEEQEKYANKIYNEEGRLKVKPEGISDEEYKKSLKKIAIEKRDRLMPIINEKEELYEKQINKLNRSNKKFYEDIDKVRNLQFTSRLKKLEFFKNPNKVASMLQSIEDNLTKKKLSDFNATIDIEYKGKTHHVERNFQEFIDSLANMPADDHIQIKNIEVDNVDELELDDFTGYEPLDKNKFYPHIWEEIVKKYNNKK